MIRIEIADNILNIINTETNVKNFNYVNDLSIKLFDVYDTSKPNNRYPHCSIFNKYTGNDITLFNANTLDPESSFYNGDFDEYVRLIGDYIVGEFICLDNIVYISDELNDYYLTDKSGNNNDAQLYSNSVYYNGTAFSEYILTDLDLNKFDVTILYSIDNITFNQYDSSVDEDVTGLVYFDYQNEKIVFGYDGTEYFVGYISKIEIYYNAVLEATFFNSSGDTEYEYPIN
jgi:hypothetical protein